MKPYYLLALLGSAAAHPTDLKIVRDTDSTEQAETAVEWTAAVGTVVSAGGTVVLAGAAAYGVYHSIAVLLKDDSQKGHCGASYITKINNKNQYTYAHVAASTTGSNCDTTAAESAIEKSLDDCATYLHSRNAESGCCTLRHGGGTWRGHVKLARNRADLDSTTCPPAPQR